MQPVPSSPQMWSRFSQWPISWVAVRPRLNGAAAVPMVPNAGVEDDDAVGGRRAAGELGVAEQAAAEAGRPRGSGTGRTATRRAPPVAADLTRSSLEKLAVAVVASA